MDGKRIQSAVGVAVSVLDKRIKQLAFEANLHETLKCNAPETVAAAKERAALREAKEVLLDLAENG